MKKYFYFGEKLEKYKVRVLNEREVRAGAGILFLFAIISFQTAWLTGDLTFTKIFVMAFMTDFLIRILVNPKYAPSLILGRLAVMNQKVEYVGAPQKRFAWSIGLVLSVAMFYLLVLNNAVGIIGVIICFACLAFLFFESALGICLGCKMYNLFNKEKAKLCPGGKCEVFAREKIQKISLFQIGVIALFFLIITIVANMIISSGDESSCKKESVVVPVCPFLK